MQHHVNAGIEGKDDKLFVMNDSKNQPKSLLPTENTATTRNENTREYRR